MLNTIRNKFKDMHKSKAIMSRLMTIGSIVLISAVGITSKPAASDSETTILHGGWVLAVPGNKPIEKASVIIRNGDVVAIAEGHITRAEGDENSAKIVDLSDRFIMPGFLDLHVHLSQQYNDDRSAVLRKPESYRVFKAANYAKKTFFAGFTTVRDLGSRGKLIFSLRDAIKDGYLPGPKILVAGSAITPTGGHGDIHGFNEQVLDLLADGNTCDGPDDCRRAVRAMVKRGADVIKVTATGGVLSQTGTGTGQQFTDAELVAIVETAHALGRKVTGHAHEAAGIEAALNAGFDNIEHAMWADEDTMKLFRKTGAWMVPTVYPITFVGDTPEKMRAGPFGKLPPVVLEKLFRLGRQPKDMTALAHKMGVNIALGTDSGVSPHGENANEFVEYVNAGMTPMQSLMAGTVNAAEAAGIPDVGHLAPGMAADIVAMPGNPLDDISAVLGVDFVMRDGTIFKQP